MATSGNGKRTFEIAACDGRLPQETVSLCPECLATIPAVLCERSDQVWMEKTCPQHGDFRELISPDARFYKQLDQWDWTEVLDNEGAIAFPLTQGQGRCPQDCGLCSQHRSSTMMSVIDITNRCNLRCPFCFANATVSGRVCEMSLDQIKDLMAKAFTVNKVSPPCLQFTGGEPTIHPQFLQALREAKKLGFAQLQIASNGVTFARDAEFAQAASEAGLNVVYLQFDGVDDGVYLKTRGTPLWELKNRAVENIRKAGMEIILVPTLIKGVNDHQIGDIFRFAVANCGTVVGVSWQPVAFVGRVDHEQRLAQRFTVTDLARELEKQTDGRIRMYRDWYPLSFVMPFSRLLRSIHGEDFPMISCHRHCGAGNYILVDPASHSYRPLTAFLDVQGLIGRMNELAGSLEHRRWLKKFTLMRAMKDVDQYFDTSQTLPGWSGKELLKFMNSFANFRKLFPDNAARLADIRAQRYPSILMVAMHFMDVYNFEVPRAQRCVVHYTGADGKMYPFCTYNGGPCFRQRVEAQFEQFAARQYVCAGSAGQRKDRVVSEV